MSLNQFSGSTPPRNLDFLGPKYIWFGFFNGEVEVRNMYM